MTDVEGQEPEIRDQVFGRKASWSNSPTIWRVVALVALAVAICGFLLAVRFPGGPMRVQAMSTMPMLAALGAYLTSRAVARSPSWVVVGSGGLRLGLPRGEVSIPWERVALSHVTTTPLSQRRNLALDDETGKRIATISDSVGPFDELVALVGAEVARRAPERHSQLRYRKARRQAYFLIGVALFTGVVAVGGVVSTRHERSDARLLAGSSIPGSATVVRHFKAPDGVTCRIEYQVVGADPPVRRNAEVTSRYWESVSQGDVVPIVYVESAPRLSRLLEGEVESRSSTDDAVVMGIATVFMVGFGIACLVLAVLTLCGWSVDFDKATRKFSMKRNDASR